MFSNVDVNVMTFHMDCLYAARLQRLHADNSPGTDVFSKSLFANLYMNALTTLHFTQQISQLRTQSHHFPNPIATNGAGVCQYDITNATVNNNYSAVSMTNLGTQFKDNQINQINVDAPYVQQKLAKWDRKPQKVYGPHNFRASTFITENKQCRGCRCNMYKVHTCTGLIKITMNGNGHNNKINCNLISNNYWWIQFLINCWIMQLFNITLNDCSELSGLMFTVNILFQIITTWYLMPALDK